jgi:DNA-binding beta-propeller fold protein YncE
MMGCFEIGLYFQLSRRSFNMRMRHFLIGLPIVVGTFFSVTSGFATVQDGPAEIRLSLLGRYASGVYKQSAAEIVAYESEQKRAYVVNSAHGVVDVLDLSQPATPTLLFSLNAADVGTNANSVAVKNGIVAMAIAAAEKTDPGFVVFFNNQGQRTAVLEVGALPDAVTFSPDGKYLLVANEGEPNDDYSVDPEGSVSLIDLSGGVENLTQSNVRTADFRSFNGQEQTLRAKGVRIFGPGATAAQDFEPEWIEVSSDSCKAYVCLQENNAIAVIDIPSAKVESVMPLGFKNWSKDGKWSGKGFDASDEDGGIHLRHWPVFGIFQPDTIRLREVNGQVYILGANEGDGRSWGWSEEARVAELRLDPKTFPNAVELQRPENLGRLTVTTTLGIANQVDPSRKDIDVKSEAVYDSLYAFGGRSMAIWRVGNDGLELVYDTGSQMEETIAEQTPHFFNADGPTIDSGETRSPAKGPEPEGMVVGDINGRTYAFVGLERVGGIMVYDVTNPVQTKFIQYINTRTKLVGEATESQLTNSDIAPEGLCFVPGSQSPDAQGRPLLLVGNEVSGTTSIFVIDLSPVRSAP